MVTASYAWIAAAHPRSIVIDLDTELDYWSRQLPALRGFRTGLPPDHYTTTLRFAYDSYLLHPHDRVDEMLPWLRDKYMRLHSSKRLEWQDAEPVVRAVWERLKAPGMH